MLGHDTGPDDVDLIDVVIRGLSTKLLVVDGEAVGGALFAGNELGRGPGRFVELADRRFLPWHIRVGG